MRGITILSYVLVAALASAATYFIINQNNPVGPAHDHGNLINTDSTSTKICLDYDNEDMNTLDVDLVHTMVDGYKSQQWKTINNDPTFQAAVNGDDARAAWFDLESLKKFIYHIEKVSKSVDTTINSNKLGVRFYYASYPNKEGLRPYKDLYKFLNDENRMDYLNRHTLVLIPTIQNEKGEINDFNPLDKGTYDGSLLEKDVYKKGNVNPIPNSSSRAVMGLSSTNRDSGSKNHGMLTPPDAVTTLAF